LSACAPIRPFCRLVLGHLEAIPRGSTAPLKDGGLHGVSIDFASTDCADNEFIAWMRTLMAAVRPVGKTVITYKLDSLRHAALAGLMGATHASFRQRAAKQNELEVVAAPLRRDEDNTEEQMRWWQNRTLTG
jgi:hypothetical protein